MSKIFYITTTLPYVNSDPHLGFAQELVYADVLARYHKLLGEAIFFNTGTDEHGTKVYHKALESGKTPQEYVDEYANKFAALIPRLRISQGIHFIRTTDGHHRFAAQEFWKRCEDAGDIYKAKYQVKYCVGCELEKTDSELVGGLCPLHSSNPLELVDEENYFFRFSKYQKKLLELYEKDKSFVVPEHRLHEIREFVAGGLKDFSISRIKEKMPWGIPVPGDESQVMYVWFDALINYISTLGWPEEAKRGEQQETGSFENYWGTHERPNAVQIAGKDNLRQQSAMWQAMLMSAGLPPSKKIIIHGFINSGGQKMSKSLGNVVNPFEIVEKLREKGVEDEQAIDVLRYFLCREMSTFEDSDFTWERFIESHNANLANGLGNLVSRILKMARNAGITDYRLQITDFDEAYKRHLEYFEIQKAAEWVWGKIKQMDEYIAREEPFKVIKVDAEKGRKQIEYLLSDLASTAYHLQPLLPGTAENILSVLTDEQKEIPRLFPRV